MDTVTTIETKGNPSGQRFTVCVLLYGNHIELAERCLLSVRQLPTDVQLRIGLNAPSDEVMTYVMSIVEQETKSGRKTLVYKSTENIGKYPLMRRMFKDVLHPLGTRYLIWLDDDSYITTPTETWLEDIEVALIADHMCGEIMTCNFTDRQLEWIQLQPWYAGVPIGLPSVHNGKPCRASRFVVGGFWACRVAMLRSIDWPVSTIVHRGGDVMMGEVMRQQGFTIRQFAAGVAINADEKGENHKMKRRGRNDVPIGMDYEPSITETIHFATKDVEPKLLDYTNL